MGEAPESRGAGTRARELEALHSEIVACRACPRLVQWREQVAREKVARFADEDYWGRPVPGFGDPTARVLALGLAPGAHGANRTGRMFTGDRSGEFLYGALERAGYASQSSSTSRDDGMTLQDMWISAVNRCAPPANKPTTQERDRCLPFFERELALLEDVRVLLCLGAFAWDGALRALAAAGVAASKPKPRFGHGAEAEVGSYLLLGSFHPSQQNTFTGKLTPGMMDDLLARAHTLSEI